MRGYSGQGIQIYLRCIDEIKVKENVGQPAVICIPDGGQSCNLLFENMPSIQVG